MIVGSTFVVMTFDTQFSAINHNCFAGSGVKMVGECWAVLPTPPSVHCSYKPTWNLVHFHTNMTGLN